MRSQPASWKGKGVMQLSTASALGPLAIFLGLVRLLVHTAFWQHSTLSSVFIQQMSHSHERQSDMESQGLMTLRCGKSLMTSCYSGCSQGFPLLHLFGCLFGCFLDEVLSFDGQTISPLVHMKVLLVRCATLESCLQISIVDNFSDMDMVQYFVPSVVVGSSQVVQGSNWNGGGLCIEITTYNTSACCSRHNFDDNTEARKFLSDSTTYRHLGHHDPCPGRVHWLFVRNSLASKE